MIKAFDALSTRMGWSGPLLGLAILLMPTLGLAFSPLQEYNDLVAGDGQPGFGDGLFYEAQFNGPEGLALNADGSVLYVADEANQRIRAIDLDHQNQVQTIAGTGEAGSRDGSLLTATFNFPQSLAVLPDGQIAVAERREDGSLIRLIDLKAGTVSTLAGSGYTASDGKGTQVRLGYVWNLAYRPEDNDLYFSEPERRALRRLNLKTGLVETVFQDNDLLPHPKAICVLNNQLYAADRDVDQVYLVTGLDRPAALPVSTATPAAVVNEPVMIPVTLKEVGRAHKIIALAGTAHSLYAYEGDAVAQSPIVRLSPDPQTLTFVSVWGDALAHAAKVMPYFLEVNETHKVGFISDPRLEGRFFISNPVHPLIASIRDLNFGAHLKNASENFDYPAKKPLHTYRILLVGRSFLVYEWDNHWGEDPWLGTEATSLSFNVMKMMAKKLELELNTQAALRDMPIHFEVFNYHQVISPAIWLWSNYRVPDVVKNEDIDMVIMMLDPSVSSMEEFTFAPMTREGIPAEGMDYDFVAKPDSEKFAEPMRSFFELFRQKKMVATQGKKWVLAPFPQLISDEAVRDKILDLIGKPIALLKKKLDLQLTSDGQPCQLALCYFPTPSLFSFPRKSERLFWKDISLNNKLPFIDLTDDFLVTRLTYYPFSQLNGINDHFSTNGHSLWAHLLAYELIKNKVLPF